MRKNFIYISFFLSVLCSFIVKAQHSSIDSIKKIINQHEQSDSVKATLYIQVAKAFRNTDYDSAISYNEKAISIAQKENLKTVLADACNYAGNLKSDAGEFDAALKNYQAAYNFKPKKTLRDLAEYYNYIALAYWGKGAYKNAEFFENESIKAYSKLNDLGKLSYQYINLGSIYGSQDKTIEATEYFYKALKIKQQLGDSLAMAGCYSNLSNVYQHVEEYQKSLEFAKKALDIRQKCKPYGREYAAIYNNMGVAYEATGEHQKALDYFRVGMRYAEKANAIDLIGQFYCNMGQSIYSLNKGDSSIIYLNKSLEILESIHYDEGVMYAYNFLADIKLDSKKYEEALMYAHKSLDIATEIGSISIISDNSEIIYKVYKEHKDWKNALVWMEQFNHYLDSLHKVENLRAIAELNYNNQLDDRDHEIRILSKENAIKNQENKTQRLYIYVFICVALLIHVFSYAYYKQVKKLSKLNQQLEQQNEKIAHQSEGLANMNQLKDRVISVMSHDMRGPISALYSIVELFNSKQLSQEEMEFIFPELGKSVNSVSILLENILGWVKTQMKNGNEVVLSDVFVFPLVEDVIKIYQQTAEEKGIRIINLLPCDLFIKTDENNLSLILRNLINNAIKFSNNGQKVEIFAGKVDNVIRIVVKDYGVGMSDEEVGKLFNTERLHTSLGTKNEKGTGLGLLLVKVSVENLKGSLTIDSEKGAGSAFIITLPVE